MSTANDLFRKLLDRAAETGTTERRYVPNPLNAVRSSSELTRILRLPARTLNLPGAPVDLFTRALRTPHGTWTLKPIQAAALEELHDYRGLLGIIGVGRGKTLLTLLAGEVLEAKRPVLVLPAALLGKTKREFAELREHWSVRRPPTLVTYELLSRGTGVELLKRLDPDLLIADECHRLKNPKAACTRTVKTHMDRKPETIFAGLSGTVTSRSILEFAHLSFWALGKMNLTPIPLKWRECQDWSLALDEKIPDEMRMAPGALEELCGDDEALLAEWRTDSLSAARKAFRGRLISTPGVVATIDDMHPASINVEAVDPLANRKTSELDAAFRKLRDTWETPDGWEVSDAVTMWRHEQELACGFFYRWEPRPPDWWLEPRQEWSRFVRETLSNNRRGLFSEAPVAAAAKRGDLGREGQALQGRWAETRDRFVPNKEAVWVSDAMIEWCASEMEIGDGTICWVQHRAFGEKLAKVSGRGFFSNDGLDARGRTIESMRGESVIASIKSNSTGRNLQAWHRNLVVCPPTKGGEWEQMLGRTHREGQESDEIDVRVVLACKGQLGSFEQALADARMIQDTTGQPQKLLYATGVAEAIGGKEVVARRRGVRW